MTLVGLLLTVLLVCVVLWATQRLLAAFSVADPIRTVVIVAVVLIVLVWLLGAGDLPRLR